MTLGDKPRSLDKAVLISCGGIRGIHWVCVFLFLRFSMRLGDFGASKLADIFRSWSLDVSELPMIPTHQIVVYFSEDFDDIFCELLVETKLETPRKDPRSACSEFSMLKLRHSET